MWVPQLFSIIAEYQADFSNGDNSDADLCMMIEYKVNKSMQMMVHNDSLVKNSTRCEAVSQLRF